VTIEGEKRTMWFTGVHSPTSHRGQLSMWQLCRRTLSSTGQLESAMTRPLRSTQWAFRVWTPPPHVNEHCAKWGKKKVRWLTTLVINIIMNYTWLHGWNCQWAEWQVPLQGSVSGGGSFKWRQCRSSTGTVWAEGYCCCCCCGSRVSCSHCLVTLRTPMPQWAEHSEWWITRHLSKETTHTHV
jgi:hypothetical protein